MKLPNADEFAEAAFLEKFEKIGREIAANAPPISCGWLDDASFYFCGCEHFSKAAAMITDNPLCQLELRAELARSVADVLAVRNILTKIWTDLSIYDFVLTGFFSYKEAAVFRFMGTNGGAKILTGRMIVSGERYEELVWMKEQSGEIRYANAPADLLSSTGQCKNVVSEKPLYWPQSLADDEKIRQEILAIVAKVTGLIGDVDKKAFAQSESSIDAMRFNLDALFHATRGLRFDDFDVREWRRPLSRIGYQRGNPNVLSGEMLWDLAAEHVPLIFSRLST